VTFAIRGIVTRESSFVNYELERLGIVMEPDPDDPREAWGVLNPAAARGDDGELYLFPRLVAEGNFSRIGRARVVFDGGEPVGVERLGVALEPEEPWEGKGVEDPRITSVEELGVYLMTYTAYGPQGPRIAVASSPNLERWERHGLVSFGSELDAFDNKDAAFFPERATGAFALIHRPANQERPGIWVSFGDLTGFHSHRRVAGPEQPWEELKIGAGPPPIRVDDGWLLLYHGVSGRIVEGVDLQQDVRYCAGVMLLDHLEVWRVLDRTRDPLLEPETGEERRGIVPNVVFPTAVDERPDGTWDVYYGMADSRIGVARLRRRSAGGQSARPRGTSTQP
jgi:beta-1,2-mannobiose phosphorylase / 1,2-beta-oligomannan phosphorylase